MKKIYILFIAVLLTACGTQNSSGVATTKEQAAEQKTETAEAKTSYSKDASGNLTGVVDKKAFMQEPFNSWFESRYEAYTPDEDVVEGLVVSMKDVKIRAYMGTWCGDSKRETPQFYNILDAINYNYDNLTMITVDRSKQKPMDLVSGYNVIRVPTFIFYRGGTEIGRYVERPRESLEKDMLKIVTGQEYKHSYDN